MDIVLTLVRRAPITEKPMFHTIRHHGVTQFAEGYSSFNVVHSILARNLCVSDVTYLPGFRTYVGLNFNYAFI